MLGPPQVAARLTATARHSHVQASPLDSTGSCRIAPSRPAGLCRCAPGDGWNERGAGRGQPGLTKPLLPLLRADSLRVPAPQFALAWLGTSSLQKGPLWWCSHHRHHHRTADTDADAHSPVAHGFWWSHCGWFLLTDRHTAPLLGAVPDLVALPELVWLERFYLVPPASLAAAMWLYGGGRALCYGFCMATVLCWHATYAINSVAHLLGNRTFACQFNGACTARNNLVLALLTLGEGWHNNHHRFMASALHGFVQPWEIDLTFYAIRLLEITGLAWNLRKPPGDLIAHAYKAAAKHTAVLHTAATH